MAPTRRLVALLRGINVGGHRKVPMAALRDALTAAGAGSVATYIQSGNVAFDTDLPLARAAAMVAGAVAASSGVLDVAVVVRERSAIAELIDDCPFPTSEPKKVHVAFLPHGATTAEGLVADLDPAAFAPEDFRCHRHELYLWLPHGGGRSPLDTAWQRVSGRSSTARNWATVCTLATL